MLNMIENAIVKQSVFRRAYLKKSPRVNPLTSLASLSIKSAFGFEPAKVDSLGILIVSLSAPPVADGTNLNTTFVAVEVFPSAAIRKPTLVA